MGLYGMVWRGMGRGLDWMTYRGQFQPYFFMSLRMAICAIQAQGPISGIWEVSL